MKTHTLNWRLKPGEVLKLREGITIENTGPITATIAIKAQVIQKTEDQKNVAPRKIG